MIRATAEARPLFVADAEREERRLLDLEDERRFWLVAARFRASARDIRMVSSDFSRRLCAFSVLSARILNATSASGTSSATIVRMPSFLSACNRWLPFGVQYRSSWRTATIGSRKRPMSP